MTCEEQHIRTILDYIIDHPEALSTSNKVILEVFVDFSGIKYIQINPYSTVIIGGSSQGISVHPYTRLILWKILLKLRPEKYLSIWNSHHKEQLNIDLQTQGDTLDEVIKSLNVLKYADRTVDNGLNFHTLLVAVLIYGWNGNTIAGQIDFELHGEKETVKYASGDILSFGEALGYVYYVRALFGKFLKVILD